MRRESSQLVEAQQLIRETGLRTRVHECQKKVLLSFRLSGSAHFYSVTLNIRILRYTSKMDEKRVHLGRHFWQWLVMASLVRSPVLMSSVAFTSMTALVLYDADRGGVLAGASVLGLLLGTPIALVMQRRWSPRILLTAQLIACALCWSALAGTLTLGRDMPTWILLAAAAGVSMSGSAGLVRATMVNAVPVQLQPRASTIDALAQDAVIFLGPVAVAVGVVNGPVGAPLAVVAVSLLAVIAVNVFRPGAPAANSLSVNPSAPSTPASSPTWIKRLLWSLLSLAIGMTLGAAEAGAVGLVTDWGLPVTSVWQVFLVLAAASAVGAFLDITVLQRIRVRPRLATFLMSMATGCFFVATDSSTVIVGVGLILIGLPTAPLLGLRSNVFDRDDHNERTTGLTVALAAQSVGFATGASLLAVTGRSGALLVSACLLITSGLLAAAFFHPARANTQR